MAIDEQMIDKLFSLRGHKNLHLIEEMLAEIPSEYFELSRDVVG